MRKKVALLLSVSLSLPTAAAFTASRALASREANQVVEGELLLPSGTVSSYYRQCDYWDLEDGLPDDVEHPAQRALHDTFGHIFDVDPATVGHPFDLRVLEGGDSNLDIVFRSPEVGFATIIPGGERGIVPPGSEQGYVCMAEGTRARFRYEAGPSVPKPSLQDEAAIADHSNNLNLLAHEQSPDSLRRMVFQGNVAIASSKHGLSIYRLMKRAPFIQFKASYYCPGGRVSSDISVWGNYVFQSVPEEYPYLSLKEHNKHESDVCNNTDDSLTKGGIRVVDISEPDRLRQVAFFEMACGSMNHTLVPHGGELLLYVPTPCDEDAPALPGGVRPLNFEVRILRFDPNHPDRSERKQTPAIDDITRLEHPGGQLGCHDITIFPVKQLAACPQFFNEVGKTSLLNITDPLNPRVISHLQVPPQSTWMSYASFTWDGRYLLLSDSGRAHYDDVLGARTNQCASSNEEPPAAVWIYDVADPTTPQRISSFTLPRDEITPDEACAPWEINMIPTKDPQKRLAVMGWNSGGMTIVDLSDPRQPRELGHWHPAPLSIALGSYFYNGRIYALEYWSGPGVRVFDLAGYGRDTTRSYSVRMNPQTQLIEFRN